MMRKTISARFLSVVSMGIAVIVLTQGCQTSSVVQPSPSGSSEKPEQSKKAKYASPEEQKPAVDNAEIQTKAVAKSVKPPPSVQTTKSAAASKPKSYSPETPKSVTARATSAKQNEQAKSNQSKNSVKNSAASTTTKTAREAAGSATAKAKSQTITKTMSEAKNRAAAEPASKPADLKEVRTHASTAQQTPVVKENEVTENEVTGNDVAASVKDMPPKTSSEETQLALAEPFELQGDQNVVKEAVAKELQKINLTADMLPRDFGSWTLEHNWDNKHPSTCRLRSAKTMINDGYETTWLWAEILPDEINIYTGSNIDLEYEGSGLQFGSQTVRAFSGFLNETAVNMAGDHRKALLTANTVTVYLGFWPTWPKTEIQKVILPAQGLAQALPVFDACQTWSE